jgi:hypothetical protein
MKRLLRPVVRLPSHRLERLERLAALVPAALPAFRQWGPEWRLELLLAG